MEFKVSHYNFLWGGVFAGVVGSWTTSNYWLVALAALFGAAVSYVWTFKEFGKSGVPTVRAYLDSLHNRKQPPE
jgi:hypothetical protein